MTSTKYSLARGLMNGLTLCVIFAGFIQNNEIFIVGGSIALVYSITLYTRKQK